ncbi:MAG: dodecin [Acidimicrobiales bacterium]
MSDNSQPPIYRIVEVTGTSTESVSDAVANAVARASKTLRNIEWFNVEDIRGRVGADGTIASFQVTSKIGFRLEDTE